jgi:hypothetical protein
METFSLSRIGREIKEIRKKKENNKSGGKQVHPFDEWEPREQLRSSTAAHTHTRDKKHGSEIFKRRGFFFVSRGDDWCVQTGQESKAKGNLLPRIFSNRNILQSSRGGGLTHTHTHTHTPIPLTAFDNAPHQRSSNGEITN